ncbi:MAG: type I glyceraldehyde-3-phosphate dehydrogenase [Acidobacteriota bacterium]|jgi:glyceraldehyde 3-phosphate dehydrogenase
MTTRIGINGFGRIGRSVLRILTERDDMEVVAVNDLFDNQALAYLLQHDTVMGRFRGTVEIQDDVMVVNGQSIRMLESPDPGALPWGKMEVDVVVESTGRFRTRESLQPHLEAGARRIVLTVPSKDPVDATVVIGVNDDEIRKEHRIISNASCTTNCLAPLVKVLDEAFGLEKGFMTTVHAYTNDQRLADVPHKDLRRSRAAAQNIIPTTTGAAKAVGKVLPHLQGRLDGVAMRVPVPDGSVVDLSVRLGGEPTPEDVNAAVRKAAEGALQGVLEYSTQPIVSSDVIGNPHSSIFDAACTQSAGEGFVKTVSWYDNEWGYSCRVVDLIQRLAELDRG